MSGYRDPSTTRLEELCARVSSQLADHEERVAVGDVEVELSVSIAKTVMGDIDHAQLELRARVQHPDLAIIVGPHGITGDGPAHVMRSLESLRGRQPTLKIWGPTATLTWRADTTNDVARDLLTSFELLGALGARPPAPNVDLWIERIEEGCTISWRVDDREWAGARRIGRLYWAGTPAVWILREHAHELRPALAKMSNDPVIEPLPTTADPFVDAEYELRLWYEVPPFTEEITIHLRPDGRMQWTSDWHCWDGMGAANLTERTLDVAEAVRELHVYVAERRFFPSVRSRRT